MWTEIRKLPDHRIEHKWVEVDAFPASKRLPDNWMMVDKCYKASWRHGEGVPHSMHIAHVVDHPFLAELNEMPHAPKAVKAIYRKEVRLKHLMTDEWWSISEDLKRAEDAWKPYMISVLREQGKNAKR